jgi:hypothetical protein
MPKLLPHLGKKGSLLHPLLPEQTVSSQFLFLPICRQGGIWSFEASSRFNAKISDTDDGESIENVIRDLLVAHGYSMKIASERASKIVAAIRKRIEEGQIDQP